MHKKSIKFVSILLLLLMSLTVAGCGKEDEVVKEEVKKKVKVQEIFYQEEVDSKLTLEATVVPQEYSVIRSLVLGVVEFLAPVGSQVSVGQPLFVIRDRGIEDNYFNTLQSFQQTQVTSNQRVEQSKLALNSSKARLDLARVNYDGVLAQVDQAMTTAEDSATLSYSSSYNTMYQIILNYNNSSLDNPQFTLKDILVSDQSLRSDVSFMFNNVVREFNSLSQDTDKDNLKYSLQDIHQKLLLLKNFLDSTSILLQKAIPNEDYSLTDIATDKTINSNHQASVNNYINSIISNISNLENTKINNKLAVNNAQSQLDLAEIEYHNSEVSLQNAKDGASLEQSISQAQLDGAAYNYNNLRMPSPFSGTILSHSVKVGEQVSTGQELIEIGNLSIIEMTTDVDVNFAKAIKLGDEVLIEDKYKGLVTKIDPIGDLQSGKISVTVQSQEAGQDLVAGSTAKLTFSLSYENINTIVVPIKSVTIEASGNYVFVVGQDDKVARKNVELGQIYGDQVSVLSGLEEGDRLILLNGVFISIGDEVEIIK